MTGHAGMRLLGEVVHRLRHAVQEERFGLLLAAVPIGSGDQFFGFGHSNRREKVGKDRTQESTQPDVEEIGQIGVADVVVVGRIGGDDLVRAKSSESAHLLERQCPRAASTARLSMHSAIHVDATRQVCRLHLQNGLTSAKSQTIGIACRAKSCRDAASPVMLHVTDGIVDSQQACSTANAKIHADRFGIGRGSGAAGVEAACRRRACQQRARRRESAPAPRPPDR